MGSNKPKRDCRHDISFLLNKTNRNLGLKRRRSKRTSFKQVLPILIPIFNENPYPSTMELYVICQKIDMSYKRTITWFQNRRSRMKRAPKKFKSCEF